MQVVNVRIEYCGRDELLLQAEKLQKFSSEATHLFVKTFIYLYYQFSANPAEKAYSLM